MGRKWERCIKDVKKSQAKRYGYQKYNPYAVCTKSVGRLNAKRKKSKSMLQVFDLRNLYIEDALDVLFPQRKKK